MKTAFTDLSDSRKELSVEIPTAIVDKAIERLSRQYSRSAKVPGFRPGKVPAKLVLTRYREQILRDVAQDLIPQAVDDALRERGVAPVATPEIRDVDVDEGKPMTFTAAFETVPPIDPGNYDGFTLRRSPVSVDDEAVDKALEQLRQSAARSEPIEGRPAAPGDTLTLDLERRLRRPSADGSVAEAAPERHVDVNVEIGSPENPPGFDEHLVGLEPGAAREFTVTFPDSYEVSALAGAEAAYAVDVRSIHQRLVPALDDELAKNLGDFSDLAALRVHVHADLEQQAEADATRDVRAELIRQLASRVSVDVPNALVTVEIERRVEHLVRHMLGQRIDPRRANVDWDAFREQQRAAATEAVRGGLVLDEIATRESLDVGDSDLEAEYARQAEMSGRTPSAVRALVEKENGADRLLAGLRREKAIDFLLARATIVTA